MNEDTIQGILQQELQKLKKEVMDGLRKEMKEMIFNEAMKSATPRMIAKSSPHSLKSLSRTLESDIAKVRADLKDLIEKLPDPKTCHHHHPVEGRGESDSHNNNNNNNNAQQHPIVINVGGHTYETRLETLRRYPATLLGMMASGHPFFSFDNHRPKGDPRGQPFFDRNSKAFEHVLEFYRTGTLQRPPGLAIELWRQELDYWNIPYHDTLQQQEEAPGTTTMVVEKKRITKKRSHSALPKVELWLDSDRKRKSEKGGSSSGSSSSGNLREETTATTTTTSNAAVARGGAGEGSKDDASSSSSSSGEWRALMSPRWENDKAISKMGHKSHTNITSLLNPGPSGSGHSADNSPSPTPAAAGSRSSSKERKAKRRSLNIFSTTKLNT